MNIIPKDLQAEIRRVSTDNIQGCNDNNLNPNQVNSAMMRAVTSSIKTIKAKSVYNLLRRLKKEDIGTNSVEFLVKRICTLKSGKQSKYLAKRVKTHGYALKS